MSAREYPASFTSKEYLLFPDDGRRHELIGGEHIVTPAPSRRHQRIATRLVRLLDAHVDERSLGEVYVAPFDVNLSDRDVVQPDLLSVAAAHLDRITESGVRGAPDLVVEIVSASSRRTDEVLKRKLYEAFRVQDYWVVDPEIQVVKVYHLRDGRFVRTAELSVDAGSTLSSPLLPGLHQAELAVLFA